MKSDFMRQQPDKNRGVSRDVADLILQEISPFVRQQLPGYVVRTDRVVPVGLEGDVLVIAMEDPDDVEVRRRIRYITDRELRVTVASSMALDHAIKVHYPFDDDEER